MKEADIHPLRGESDYDFGYRVGFADCIIQWDSLRCYTIEFQRGYNKGKAKIDEMVDDAAQARCFG